MDIEKKKKIIIAVTIITIILIGTIVGIIIGKFVNSKEATKTSSTNISNAENLQEEPLIIQSSADESEEEQQETEQPKEEETEEPEIKAEQPEEEPQNNDIPYYIKVNNKANVVTIYKKDSEGKYTVPYKAMICSIGKATPTGGVYKTYNKYTWRALVGGVYGQYATRIVGSILFHSVPYTSQNKGALEYWEYDKLGTKASAGCVRLTVEDAKWIYDNCKLGTQVEFYSSEDPGPLGKPTAQKISGEEAVRGWDPTDPDANNPWKTYTKEEQQQPKEEETVKENNQEKENNQAENNNQANTEQTNQNTNLNGNTPSVEEQIPEQEPVVPEVTPEQIPSENMGETTEDINNKNEEESNKEVTENEQQSPSNSENIENSQDETV